MVRPCQKMKWNLGSTGNTSVKVTLTLKEMLGMWQVVESRKYVLLHFGNILCVSYFVWSCVCHPQCVILCILLLSHYSPPIFTLFTNVNLISLSPTPETLQEVLRKENFGKLQEVLFRISWMTFHLNTPPPVCVLSLPQRIVVPLVVGQRSFKVLEKEWLETLRIFGIGEEDGKRIIDRLGNTLLNEHENLFGPSSSLSQLLGKGISVRTSQSHQGG